MTYVNWRVPLLHVIRGKQVSGSGELDQQVVLEAKEGRRSDNGGLGEYASGDLLTPSLCGEELGGGVGVGIVGRDVDVAVDIILGHGLGDALGSLHMNVLEAVVFGGIGATDQVVDDVRVSDTGLDGFGVV